MSMLDFLKHRATEAVKNTLKDATKTVVNKAVTESKTFTFQALPTNVEELKALPEASLDTPFKTAALTICALCAFRDDEKTGIDMLNFLKGPQPLANRDIQFFHDVFRENKYVPISYFKGATPKNNYTPDMPYSLTIHTNTNSYQNEGYCTLWLKSGGADSERQIQLRKKGNQWFLWEQFVMVGIRKAAADDPWA